MLRRIVSVFAATAAMLFLFLLPAYAQQRIALVIGNSAYQKGPVGTALADGGLVAEALTSIGFEIVEGADVNQADLQRLIRDFLAKVETGGPGTIAFVYFSGYGVEFEGENYLIPVDARLARDSDIPIETVRLFDLLRPLADAPAAARIVVLDATRPLPFQIPGRQLAPGLGPVAAAPGMLIAFSSAPGLPAADGPGPYGAYATAIAEMVREPGLNVDMVFSRIRLRTNETTNGAQTPWHMSQGLEQVMLVPGAPAAPPPPAPPVMSAVGPDQAYAYAIQQDSLGGYTEFVRVYPNSPYAARVWAIIRARREALAWQDALLMNSPEAYWTYMQRYPEGMYVYDAEFRLGRLSAARRPPPGFRVVDFVHAPPPLPGEPLRIITVLPPAPPPPRFLAPPPAFIVGLPPPPRPTGRGLWYRPQQFPVIIQPTVPRTGGPPAQGLKKGPIVVSPTTTTPTTTTTTTPPPTGAPPTGLKKVNPPPTTTTTTTPTTTTTTPPPTGGPPAQGLKKAPLVVNPTTTTPTTTTTTTPPPTGAPPTGLKKVNPPPTTTTTTTPTTTTTTTTGPPAQGMKKVNPTTTTPTTTTTTTTPTVTNPKQPTVSAPPPPPPPPPPKGPVPSTTKAPAKGPPCPQGQPNCKGA